VPTGVGIGATGQGIDAAGRQASAPPGDGIGTAGRHSANLRERLFTWADGNPNLLTPS
jgi:hypothetical protein